jgi:hypothetical protein
MRALVTIVCGLIGLAVGLVLDLVWASATSGPTVPILTVAGALAGLGLGWALARLVAPRRRRPPSAPPTRAPGPGEPGPPSHRGSRVMPFEDRRYTLAELRAALLNLHWLIRHREGGYHPEASTIVYGDGGADETELLREDFTPATEEWRHAQAEQDRTEAE